MAGSIERRKDCKTGEERFDKQGRPVWRLVVSAGFNAQGKRVKISRDFHGSSREAKRALARLITEVDSGRIVESSKMTLAEWSVVWDREHVAQLAEKTAATYRMMLKNRIIPALGTHQLSRITTKHINAFYRNLGEKKKIRLDKVRVKAADGTVTTVKRSGGLSESSQAKCHRILSAMLNEAVYRQLIPFNPAATARHASEVRHEARHYDEAALARMLEALKEKSPRLRTIVMMALTTGLRRGEIVALEWPHINFDAGTIVVQQASVIATGKGQHLKGTKTKGSMRTVGMPAQLAEELKAWQQEQARCREKCGSLWEGTDRQYVFTLDSGRWLNADKVTREFHRFVTKAKLPPLNFHGLRHTAASLLIANGLNIRVISGILGHTQASTTLNIYSHLIQDASQQGAKAMEAALGKVTVPQTVPKGSEVEFKQG